MAWRIALILGSLSAVTMSARGVPPPTEDIFRLPAPENQLIPPGVHAPANYPSTSPARVDADGNAPASASAGNDAPAPSISFSAPVQRAGFQSEVAADEYRANDKAVPGSLPRVLRWPIEGEPSEMPIIRYPGHQYVDRSLDQWFTNRYLIGSGVLGIDAAVRSYYLNDQRIEWTGQEATFAAEGALTGRYERRFGEVGVAVGSDFFLTQPFDRNMLDDPERRSYFANFDYRPFDISQLYVEMRKNRFVCRVGKMITPFGRYYYPVDTNMQFDAPFIRTECIRKRETGILLQYLGDYLTADIAGVNGSDDRDTNSSKGAVGRLGLCLEPFNFGVSGKLHDGIGSENQKAYNNHLGADAAWRSGKWTISGEVIYDEYGFYHDFDPNSIFWEHGIYYREVNKDVHARLSGVGWYVDCLYRGERWLFEFNYGQYHPEQLGIPQHDAVKQRGIVRIGYDITERLQIYNVVMIENSLPNAQAGRDRKTWVEMLGLQYLF
ncbi:MAG: hypothetical protein IT426_08185 [Pirellulales bacterium]|nr:hypothetical protein [Pirellulales bacterium]